MPLGTCFLYNFLMLLPGVLAFGSPQWEFNERKIHLGNGHE